MKLNRLIVNNFGMFRGKREFDLDDNIVTIYGDNFTGKTTISQAIYFAVSGKGLTTGLKLKDLVASDETRATVGIIYSISNQAYRTYRSSKGDVQHELLENQAWQLIDSEDLKFPSLNQQQWQIGCFLKEEELGEFVTKTPANRRDLLNQLLGIEQLMSVQDCFVKVRRLAKRNKKNVVSQQSSMRLDEDEDRSIELEECRDRLPFLEEKLKNPEDAESKQILREEWEEQKEVIEELIESKTERYQSLLSGFNNIGKIKDTLQETIDRLSERDQYEQELEKLKEKRIELSEKLKQTNEMRTVFKNLHGQKICPTCQQPISEEHTVGLEKKHKKTYDDLETQLCSVKDDEQDAHETMDLFEELSKREVDLRRRLEQMDILDEELTEARQKLAIMENKIASVSDVTDIEKDNIRLKKELDDTRTRLRDLEKEHALYQENRRRIEELNQQASTATHNQLLSEWVADAVALTLESVMGSSLKRVEDSVMSCLDQFNLFRSDDLVIDLEKSKLMPDIDNRTFQTLSGSEKAILYLGMKLALSRLMPGAQFFVLDNPTLHLDDQRKKLMKDYLLDLLPDKQIILLTNDRSFADLITEGKRIDL